MPGLFDIKSIIYALSLYIKNLIRAISYNLSAFPFRYKKNYRPVSLWHALERSSRGPIFNDILFHLCLKSEYAKGDLK
jgi:hypothetical protein